MEGKAPPGRAFCPRCGRKYAVPEEELKRRPGVRFRGTCWHCDSDFVVVWKDGALGTELEERLPEPPPDERDILPRGLRIGKYEIEERLAAGGSSAVYRAFESGANRHVALKVLHRSPDSDYALRFRREVEVQANLKHPNLMPIFDQGTVEGKPFYTMELLQRPVTLEAIVGLHRSSRIAYNPLLRPLASRRELLRHVLLPVARAIDFANRRHGILHRDLKPDNVLVDARTLRVYVIDFGICHSLREKEAAVEERQRLAMGSIRSMPPEQARGEASPQGDVWALGALLYFILAGDAPVARALDLERVNLDQRIRNLEAIAASCRASGDLEEAAFYEARLDELRTGEVRTQRDLVRDAQDGVYVPLPTGTDPSLAAIVWHAMARDPKERYPDAAAFAEDLEAWLDGRPVRAHALALGPARAALHAGRLFVRRNRTPLVAAGSVLLLALAAGLLLFARLFSREEERVEEWLARARSAAEPALAAELLGKVLTLRPDHEEAKDLLQATRAFAPLQEKVAEATRVRARLEEVAAREKAPSGAASLRAEAEELGVERLAREMAAVLERVVLPDLKRLPANYPGRRLERDVRELAGFLKGRRFLVVSALPEGVEALLVPPLLPDRAELDWSAPRPLRPLAPVELEPGSYVLLFRRPGPPRPLCLPFRITRATPTQLVLSCPRDPALLPPDMVFVEGDERCDVGDPRFQEEAKQVRIPSFLIDAKEVTNALYAEYLAALAPEERALRVPRRLLPAQGERTAPLWTADGEASWVYPEGTGDHPVTGVSIEDARSYAAWRGARLPTAQEWERAARGVDGRDYPFGDALDPGACNAHTGSIAATGSHPADLSPFGVLDLAGNVAEWVEEESEGGQAAVKGGSFDLPRFRAMAASLDRRRGDLPHADVGFRCARAAE